MKIRVREEKSHIWKRLGEELYQQFDYNNRILWSKVRSMRRNKKKAVRRVKNETPMSNHNNRNTTSMGSIYAETKIEQKE